MTSTHYDDDRAARILRAACYALTALSALWLLACAYEPLRLNWGDPWSDGNVLTALRYFHRDGFLRTSFTEVYDVGPLTETSYYYTHYPQLPALVHATIQKILGPVSLGTLRLFAVAFSIAGLLVIRRYVAQLFGRTAGALAMALFATNFLWFQYADSIHQAPINTLLGFGALTLAASYWGAPPSRWQLAGLGVATFFCYLASYDYYFFLPIALVATALLRGRSLRERAVIVPLALTAAAAVLAFVAKSAAMIGALGWDGFKADLMFQFFERATTEHTEEYRHGLKVIMFHRLLLYFTPAFFALVACHVACAIALVRARRRGSSTVAVRAVLAPAVYLVAGLPFLIVFSQLTASQALPSQVLLPYYAIGLAVTLAFAFGRGRLARGLAAVALVAIVAWQVAHARAMPKAFLEPDAVAKVNAYLDEHDRNDVVLTTILMDGPVMAYFHRHHFYPSDGREGRPLGFYASIARAEKSGAIHLLRLTDPDALSGDKLLWQLFVHEERWRWIANPLWSRDEMLAGIRAYDRRVLEGIEGIATTVVDAGSLVLYRIDAQSLEAYAARVMPQPTRELRLGDPATDPAIEYGLRWAEDGPEKGYRWSVPHAFKRTVLTKVGVEWWPIETPRLEAGVLVRLEPGRAYRASAVVWGATGGQTLGAEVNGRPVLAPTALGGEFEHRTVTFDIPAEALAGDGLQRLRFSYAKVNDAGVGVAFQSIAFAPL